MLDAPGKGAFGDGRTGIDRGLSWFGSRHLVVCFLAGLFCDAFFFCMLCLHETFNPWLRDVCLFSCFYFASFLRVVDVSQTNEPRDNDQHRGAMGWWGTYLCARKDNNRTCLRSK